MRRRTLTIDFSAANDRILTILGLLESSYIEESESSISFIVTTLVKILFKIEIFYHFIKNLISNFDQF